MKRMVTVLLAIVLLASLCIPAAMADAYRMYVYTQNGKTLNLREGPSTSSKAILKIPYGSEVWISENLGNGWCYGHYGGAFGYMQTRFLQRDEPTAAQTAAAEKVGKEQDAKKLQNEIDKELKTLKAVDPFMVAARPARSSGWINFRTGPNANAARIASYGNGKELKVIGETTKWYQAVDPDNNKTGFVSKNYVTVLPQTASVSTTVNPDTKEQLGKLDVNGEFTLQCRLPEGYTMQVVNKMGTQLAASITPADVTRPILYLSVSFDDTYADVERMNDMSADDLAILEQSFTDMNEVEISYRETAYGTKLMVAREVGSDTDFIDILTIYKGYMIEFIMTPNTAMANQVLTEDQIKMCVDFLSDLDFVAAK